MTYPQEVVNNVLGYLRSGHTVRQAAEKFGVSPSIAAQWRRTYDGKLKDVPPHKVQYSQEVVRLALGLAYGGFGFKLGEVAHMLGISANTISQWKKKYLVGGHMDIPKVTQGELKHLSADDLEAMTLKDLKAYIHKLELKNAILEEKMKLLKAEGIDKLSNNELSVLVDALSQRFAKTEILKALGMSSSSYYYTKTKSKRPDRYGAARAAIKEEFYRVGGRRGYRYIRQRLRMRDVPIILSGKTVRRLMAEEHCHVSYACKRRRYTSYKGEISTAPENIVSRNFHADEPNKLWLTDITELHIPQGKVYLSPIIDCFDGMPVAWKSSTHPNADLVNSMLDEAVKQLGSTDHPICHSDRGCHYRWPGWIDRCDKYGITRSMSQIGCSPDNAAMEGFFGRLKNEFFYDRDWKGVSIKDFMDQLDNYMLHYRNTRIKESLGWMSPVQYRRSLGIAV